MNELFIMIMLLIALGLYSDNHRQGRTNINRQKGKKAGRTDPKTTSRLRSNK